MFILDDIWNAVVCFQPPSLPSLGTCDAHLCVSHTLQSALESGQEARIVLIDFCAAFARVNHHGILSTVSIKLITALSGGWMSE